jgi:hypothetical protein
VARRHRNANLRGDHQLLLLLLLPLLLLRSCRSLGPTLTEAMQPAARCVGHRQSGSSFVPSVGSRYEFAQPGALIDRPISAARAAKRRLLEPQYAE